MTNLEPDIDVGQRGGRVPVDTIEALAECQQTSNLQRRTHLERFFVFLLLLVDDAKAEQNFVRLVKV